MNYSLHATGNTPMTIPHLFATPVASRRDFLRTAGCGLGTLALTGLLDAEPTKALDPLSAHP